MLKLWLDVCFLLFSRYPIRPTSIAIRIGKIAKTGNSGTDFDGEELEVGVLVDRVGVGVAVVVVVVPVVVVGDGEGVGVLDGRVVDVAIIVAS